MAKQQPKRLTDFKKPEHWTNEPVPQPKDVDNDEELSPTRYGDWVKNGIAIDF